LKTPHISAYHIVLFVIFLVFGLSLPALSGLLIFPFSLIPDSLWQIYSIILSTFFLALTILFHRNEKYKKYWQISLAFFIASFALNLQAISGWLGFQTTTMNGLVLAMLSSSALVVASIIVLTRISGGSMYSIFLAKGKIKLGLLVGLISFLVFAALSIPGANYLFQGQNLTMTKLFSWMPWILPIVLANGLREELLWANFNLTIDSYYNYTPFQSILEKVLMQQGTATRKGNVVYVASSKSSSKTI